MRHEESRIQIACVGWFRMQYPTLAKLLFAVPNGGARRPLEGKIMKMEGTTAGVADLLLLYPSRGYHALCIEMKTATGRQQPTQREWQGAVEKHGYKYVICRSINDFVETVNEYIRA